MDRNPLRHPVLFGEYELTFDERNRLPVPASIRKVINPEVDGEAFFLVVGQNRRPWLYPKRYYEELVTQAPTDITPGEDLLAFNQMNFALACPLEWDSQGRVLIPEKTRQRTGLNKEVTLIGVKDHLELWNRSDWEARREELLSRSSEIALRAKEERTGVVKPDQVGR
jgi:MraZ protein